MGINDRLNARRTEQAGGTSFAAGGINARLTGTREREQATAQRETMFSRTPSFAVTSQNRNGAFGGGTDFLAPMREEINLASALSQAERQLAAEKAKPGIRAASKSSYTLPGEIDYDNIRDGAKIADLTDEVSRLQSALHRNIYEGAANGKTVPDGITQRQGNIGSAVPSVDAGFAHTIPIEHMTEDERRTYDYLYEKSPSMASKYGASIRAQVNERAAESLGKEIEDVSRRNPVVGVGMNLIGSMASPAAALDALGSRLAGQPYDPNSPTSYPVLMTQASQEGLTGGIENSFVKFLADTGLSTAQFLSKIPLGGWALPVMASGAAGQTAYDARKSGASTDEALKLGVIAGAAEAVLEKVPLDDVLKSFKGAASTIGAKLQLGKVFKPWLSSILGTSLGEGGEELVTEYINNIADLAIRGDEGRLAQYKQELMESGMSEQEAERKARWKYWVTDPVLSFAGGALSGGAMAGVGQASGAAGRKIQSAVENRQAKKQAEADAAAKAQQETAAAGADTTAREIFEDPEAEAAELDDVLEAEEAEQAREWAAEDRAEEERTAAQGTREGPVEDENLVRARTVLDDGVLPTAVTEERQRRAQAAKTDTERSGILAGASDADITLAQTISRAFGRKVIFASDDMRYNGKAKNGVITVNLKSGGVASQTLAHELMHTLEPYRAQYGSIVKVLRDMVSQRAGSMYIDPSDSTKNRRWETWEELRQKVYAQGYEKVYAEEGRRFTEADADYEVAANLIAEMFENSQTLEEFVRANRNIAVRIWTKVKTFARRAKALVTRERAVGNAGDALRLAGYYDQIASMFADSLRRTKYRTRYSTAKVEMNEKMTPESNSTRTANRYSLQPSFNRVSSDTIISDNRGNVNTSGEKYSLPDTDTSTEPPKAPKPKKMSWSDMVAEVANLVAPKSYTAYQKRILRDNILALYDRLNTVESPEDYERIKAETEAAAMDIAEELTAANRQEIPGRAEVRDDIKAALRQPIKVSEEAKRDFHGKYGDFFRVNMGRLGLRNAGRGIDSVYGELSEQYPEWFPADIETEGDQLRQFAKVWDMVNREDFVSESIYDVTGGEELMQADQKRIARTILDGYSQLLGVERSETQRRQDELEAAKRRNRSEYDEKLAAQEAQYAAQAEESAAVYATELAKARDEGRAAVEAERGKWMERDAKRRKAEADRKQAAEDKRRRRGGKIALGKVAEALKNGTFTQAMQKLYDELHEWEAELGRFAGQNPVDIEDAAYYDELVEKIDDRKAYINRVGQAKNKALRDNAAKFLEGAKVEEWKDKAAGLFYSISTMQRNIEQISGHSESGEQMIEEYFAPISWHNADAVRLKNDVRSRVRALNLSTKKTGQNKLSESAFVQLVGEARDNIYMLEHHMGYTTYYDKAERRAGRTLEEWRNVLDTLMVENPDMDMDKINKAIEEFTAIYDQLIESINAVRLNNGYAPISYRHGYFPHYTNDTPDGLFASLLKGLGFQVDMDGVPTSINGLTSQFRPGKQYEGYEKQRSENVGEFYNGIRLDGMGAVEGIDRYVEVAANVIFLTGDIQKLRALSDSIRFVTSKEEIKNRVKEIRKEENIPEEEKQSMIDRIYDEGEYALRNFVVELDEYTNLLAGKKSFNDRNAERFLGRGLYDFGKKMEQRIAANMVAFNPGSWLSNFIPLVQSGAVLSKGDLIRGMQETLAAGKEDDGFIARSTFLTNRIGSERMVKTAATLSSKLDKFNYKLGELQDWLPDGMGAIDMFTAQTIVRARYNENIGKGMSQETAMQEADDFAARLMGDRSKGAMPTIFSQQNPVMKLFTQYQLEVANQLFWMKDDLRYRYSDNSRKKLATALLRFFIGAAIYNFFYKSMTGRDAATDPIGMLNDFVGDVSGWCLPDLTDIPNSIREEGFTAEAVKAMFKTDRQGVIAGIGNLATNLVEEVPFVGGLIGGGRLPVSSAIPNPANILGGVGSLVKGSGKQGAAALYKELSKPLYYVAAPFGGGQVKKTLEGAAAIAQGGSFGYDKDGKAQLQYPLYRDNPADAITGAARTLLFGKTSTAQAQDWIESGFKTLSGKRTEAYRNAIAAGASQREAFDAVNAIKGEKLHEKLTALAAAEVSEDVKASLYYDLLASDKERETIDKIGNTGAVYNVLVKLKGLDGNTRGKVEAMSESGLGAAQKEEIFERHVTDTYKEKLDAVKAAGLTIDDFFTAYRYKLSAKGTQAKAEVLKKIDAMNLTSEQKDALYRCFYQEASLQNAPWHRMFPALELPEISFPNIEIPKIEFNPGF
jgi:hypothetical protein